MKTAQDKISEVKAVLRRCGFHKANMFHDFVSVWNNGKTSVLLWEYPDNNGYEIYKPLTDKNSHSNILESITYL